MKGGLWLLHTAAWLWIFYVYPEHRVFSCRLRDKQCWNISVCIILVRARTDGQADRCLFKATVTEQRQFKPTQQLQIRITNAGLRLLHGFIQRKCNLHWIFPLMFISEVKPLQLATVHLSRSSRENAAMHFTQNQVVHIKKERKNIV